MPKQIQKSRLFAFKQQQGRCYYCHAPMWTDSLETFARIHQLKKRRASHFQCTAEHLCARQNGGDESRENIAAACRYCNLRRHYRKRPLPPKDFKSYVRRRLRAGGWHGWLVEHLSG